MCVHSEKLRLDEAPVAQKLSKFIIGKEEAGWIISVGDLYRGADSGCSHLKGGSYA